MLYECQKLKNQIEIHFGITLRASKIDLLYSTVLSSVCRIPPRNIEISPEKPSVRSKKWRHSGRFGSVKGALQPALCATSVFFVTCSRTRTSSITSSNEEHFHVMRRRNAYIQMDPGSIADPQELSGLLPGMPNNLCQKVRQFSLQF